MGRVALASGELPEPWRPGPRGQRSSSPAGGDAIAPGTGYNRLGQGIAAALLLAICGTRGPGSDLLLAACGAYDAGDSRVAIRGIGSAARGDQRALAIAEEQS